MATEGHPYNYTRSRRVVVGVALRGHPWLDLATS